MNGTARILLVADDPRDLESLKFVTQEAGHEVRSATNTIEALALLEEHDFDCLFCDLSIGPNAGIEFLHEVWSRRPSTVRFLLAPSMGPDLMVTCALGAHHFIQKPLDSLAIAGALKRAESINRFVRYERIQPLVSRMRTLPTRPTLYLDIIRELRSPGASAASVGELVGKDLAISTKLIQVVNSASYGLGQKISQPSDAILMLGFYTTASLILSIEAFARFDKLKPIYFSMDRVWRHSQAVATSAKRIAELMSKDPEVPQQAFTAGLLHDIGKLALALNFEEQYNGAIKLAEKRQLTPCEVEAEIFGATHAETGGYLLALWGLPLPVVEAVATHHVAARNVEKYFSAATALHLAERLVYEDDLERSGRTGAPIDLDYPPELHITGHLNAFREIVRASRGVDGEASRKEIGTEFLRRDELQANTSPLPASGEPAPLVEVTSGSGRKGYFFDSSRKTAFLLIGCVSLALACAIAYVSNSQRQKSSIVMELEVTEDLAGKDQLSNLLVESSERVQPKRMEIAAIPDISEPPAPKLKLQAVMFNGKKSSIVVNGRSLRLGDEIEGARIVGVERNEVTIEMAGLQRTLRMQ